MSGIYIPRMEMPKNCAQCPINMEVCKRGYEYLLKHMELYDNRADDCPIVPVPPHGRLIDVDELFDFIFNSYKNAQGDARKAYRDVLDAIVAAGDVIEVEEGET